MPYRTRKEINIYRQHKKQLKSNNCEFCEFSPQTPEFIEETQHFWVIRNKFPYSLWDELGVTDHLMLVPKQHTDTLSDLPKAAASEFVDTLSRYEKNGYSIYARAPGHSIKSIHHQHTHLIKNDEQRRRFLIYVQKPHLRIAR